MLTCSYTNFNDVPSHFLEGHQNNCRQVLDWPVDPDAADAMLNPQAAADLLAEITRMMCSIEAQLEPAGTERMRIEIVAALEQDASDDISDTAGDGGSGGGGGAAAAAAAAAAAEKREEAATTELEAWEADLDQLHTRLSTQSMIIEELYVIPHSIPLQSLCPLAWPQNARALSSV